ncbi:MAG: Na+/H+ antiporter subunit E [Clostridia bacterium]|nr:Na+/H+ antiporter subunit E [Clostridia bacterium]
MFCILFGLWIVFNGKWTAEIALLGLALCALIYAFTCKYIGLTPKQEWRYIRRAGHAIAYLGFLLAEIFRANMQVLRLIWSPRLVPEPMLRSFRTGLRSEFGKAILANSITLTPGTITVHVRDDLFLVHCLDESMAEGLENSSFEQRIQKMEGKRDDG